MKNNKLSLTRILEISIPAVIVFAVSWGVFTTKINQTDAEIDTLTTTRSHEADGNCNEDGDVFRRRT